MGLLDYTMKKIANRAERRRLSNVSRRLALPRPPTVRLNSGPFGSVMYQVRHRGTGKVNYYTPAKFFSFLNKTLYFNNYDVLMANPKAPLFNNVYPRNVQRVRVLKKRKTPSPNTAARKIQSAVRKRKTRSK
jgi:hypothetical protein